MTPQKSMATLNAKLRSLTEEAAGVVIMQVVRREEVLAIWCAALMGDSEARYLHNAVQSAVRDIEAAPKCKPALCATCDHTLPATEFSLVVVMPSCDAPQDGLAVGICCHCAVTTEDVKAKAVHALARIWPDMRPFTPTHEHGGRA